MFLILFVFESTKFENPFHIGKHCLKKKFFTKVGCEYSAMFIGVNLCKSLEINSAFELNLVKKSILF